MTAPHTEGPWRWEFSAKSRGLHLVGGRPQFDLTILDFARWGTHGATMRLRDTAHDGMNIMHRLHERPDWVAPIPGREHHAHWCSAVTHPDAKLIESAPTLLAHLRLVAFHLRREDITGRPGLVGEVLDGIEGAITQATGGAL